MIARMESLTDWAMSASDAVGLSALIFFSIRGSSTAQLPSKAATSSPFFCSGQSARFQLAPAAFSSELLGLSSSSSKNARQLSGTDDGSRE